MSGRVSDAAMPEHYFPELGPLRKRHRGYCTAGIALARAARSELDTSGHEKAESNVRQNEPDVLAWLE